MGNNGFQGLDTGKVRTPAFIVDESLLENNLRILDDIQKRAGCKILLALKGFAMFSTFSLVKKYLSGTCASGLNESKLAHDEFGKEVHTYSPGFKEDEFSDIIKYSDHIVFNSWQQWERFKPHVQKSNKRIEAGLRVNPEKSVAGDKFGVYDPCSSNSRLGITSNLLVGKDLTGISGLHFHALCEQNVDSLKKVLSAFEKGFSESIKKVSWVNFGGGHHITREDYDREGLVNLIKDFKARYPNIKTIYLEPGEAVALNTGIFVSTVIDVVHNKKNTAILDMSVECHFPDVLITRHEPTPYVPEILGAGKPREKKYPYLIGGVSCAAGDVMGEFSFDSELKPGDKLVFLDAAHYSMVKTTTFNGINLATISLFTKDKKLKVVKEFSYKDYKERLS